jgi:non-ribosomal peptide synthetase component E (peptide arylation enzyme)
MTQELIDEQMALGVWRRETFWQGVEQHALRRPDALAVADQHERLTYGQLRQRVHDLSTYLMALDLEAGSSVALQTSNSNLIVVCHLACNRAGLLFVPLSDAWRRREVEHLLALSRAVVLIVPGRGGSFDYLAMVESFREGLPNLRHVGTTTGPGADFAVDALPQTTLDDTPSAALHDPNEPRFVMVTSGTTDLPKLSLWTDNDLWYFMVQYARVVEMTSDDVAVGIAPASTGSTGYCFPVLATLMHGATSILLEHWNPADALRLIADEHATIATAIPTQIIKMLQDPTLGDLDYSSLRVFTNAGAPMPAEAARQVDEVFGCAVQPLYGATDGGVPAMTSVRDPAVKRHTTVGKLLEHTTVRLVDPDLNDVPAGNSGEVLWRQPMKTSFGYMNEPERTAATFVGDGFYRSGDLGEFDADGYLRIVGRAKDIIIRGGQNLSPREIEDLAITHPSIAEIAVVGVPDPVYGERACACVVLAPDHELSLDDLNDFLLAHDLAKFKLPERLEFFDTELAKNSGAKVSKAELRDVLAARDAAAAR